MTKFVDGLRTSLETATMNMDEFLMGITSMVMYNADTVLTKYQETNLPLTDELTNPWIKAKESVGTYSGDALALMNKWTEEGGFFAQFNATGTKNLQSPWSAGSTAANTFKTSVSTVMEGVVANISTNVKTASDELSKLYQQIITTEQRAAEADVVVNNNNNNNNNNQNTGPTAAELKANARNAAQAYIDKKGFSEGDRARWGQDPAFRKLLQAYTALGGSLNDLNANVHKEKMRKAAQDYIDQKGFSEGDKARWGQDPKFRMLLTSYISAGGSLNDLKGKRYAKGTTGTTHDQWAITDEPQFGDELTMYATPEGTLSFMRAGSTVIPADLTRELIDLPKVVDGLINRPKFDSGINMIANAINKPEIVIDVENFLKVDRVDKDTLPQLEKMMDKKLNDFTRQLNYQLKQFK